MLHASFESPLVVHFVALMSAAVDDSMPQHRSHSCIDRRIFVVIVCTLEIMPSSTFGTPSGLLTPVRFVASLRLEVPAHTG